MQKIIFTNSLGMSIELSRLPFLLNKVDGLGDVNAEVHTQKAPFQDGSTYIDSILDNRLLSVEVSIHGEDPADTQQKRVYLSSVLNPKLGIGTLRYENDYGIREIKAVLDNVPVFPSGEGNRGRTYQRTLINFICPDPFWLEPEKLQEPMAAYLGLFSFPLELRTEMGIQGEKRTIINDGDVQTPVTITFNGPAVNPMIINHRTGEFIKVNRALMKDDVLKIETTFGEKRVEINGVNVFSWIDLESSFWQLQPGENEIEYLADSGRDEATVMVEWFNRYLSV